MEMANFMNDYSLEIIKGMKDRYFVSFTDGYGDFQRLEINEDVYSALADLNKNDETLIKRAFKKPKGIEELIMEKEVKKIFWQAIGELPEVQRKRLLLYYDYGFSLKEIAKMENCSIRAIQYSLEIAKKRLENNLKNC